jgi:hypothetical protein
MDFLQYQMEMGDTGSQSYVTKTDYYDMKREVERTLVELRTSRHWVVVIHELRGSLSGWENSKVGSLVKLSPWGAMCFAPARKWLNRSSLRKCRLSASSGIFSACLSACSLNHRGGYLGDRC